MNIVHTIAGTRLDHGGTSRSVPALCEAIAQRGLKIQFLTTRPANPNVPFNLPQSPVIVHLVNESSRYGRLTVGNQYQHILRSMRAAVSEASPDRRIQFLVHDHGLWLAPNHAVARFAKHFNMIRVVSPRGMLSTWAVNRGRWKKRLAWWAYQHADLQSATAFHVTAKQEAEEVRSLGFKQPIAIIPNGTCFPNQTFRPQPSGGLRRMLFLSRIHPKKGLLELVRAWKKANVGQEWRLVIAGPNEAGHQQQIEHEVRQLGLWENISFPGSVDDVAKWQMYADADVFVLPSFSENFGTVVAEALAAGRPVITTTGTPWNELPQRGCGWWVKPTIDDLALTIVAATALPAQQLAEMGQRGSEWVREQFTWEAVSNQMIQFYESLNHSSRRSLS